MNLITTIIGFGMSATFIVFICTRLICGRLRRIEENNHMFEIETRINLEMHTENGLSGLEPVAVSAIPTMKFSREAFSPMEDAQCTICLAEYQEREVLRIMPKCGHNFHLTCIDVWLRKQSTCPVCRLSVQDHRTSSMVTVSRSFDSSEVVSENSRQWLLPTSENNASGNQTRVDSASIETASQVRREAILMSAP